MERRDEEESEDKKEKVERIDVMCLVPWCRANDTHSARVFDSNSRQTSRTFENFANLRYCESSRIPTQEMEGIRSELRKI